MSMWLKAEKDPAIHYERYITALVIGLVSHALLCTLEVAMRVSRMIVWLRSRSSSVAAGDNPTT